MDEESMSIDSPVQINLGTSQVSFSATPRNDIAVVSSSSFGLSQQLGTVPVSSSSLVTRQPPSKYTQLLAVIEELGKDIHPTYAGSKSSAERLKRGIVHARILVRECLMETERNART
ncbi:uncharacterized protein LOC143254926 [Tachypleus tridentatus]|uniref:uncharacterized protein LOC143254926 n=1 Tax=Tachypleus tridentatus TaxID=6853 RepID=UPI003FD1AEB1